MMWVPKVSVGNDLFAYRGKDAWINPPQHNRKSLMNWTVHFSHEWIKTNIL